MTLTGNKGEWSEMYAFLSILGNGVMFGTDEDGKKDENVRYLVNKVIRTEEKEVTEYMIDDDTISVIRNETVIHTEPKCNFVESAEYLLDKIDRSSGPSFAVEKIEDFMNRIYCHKLKAPSSDKTDITVELHDPITGTDHIVGFSIKSNLGKTPSLVNPSCQTNFRFRLIGEMSEEIIDFVNYSDKQYAVKYQYMLDHGIQIQFENPESITLKQNLVMIDSRLPEIVAEMLLLHYVEKISRVKDQIKVLSERNPLGYEGTDTPYYQYKIKKLLSAYALGMVSKTKWNGIEDANGGLILINRDGLICIPLYDRNKFESYIVSSTRLDTPSSSRYKYSKIEKDEDGYYLKLCLQVRIS